MVLHGLSSTTPEMFPHIIPVLYNRSVTSIVHSRDHFGALTSSGKLLTWGQYSKGALGLGDPNKTLTFFPGTTEQIQILNSEFQQVVVPSEVRFDHGLKAEGRAKRYCFDAAAGGSHTVALVIDLVENGVLPEDLEQHFETVLYETAV